MKKTWLFLLIAYSHIASASVCEKIFDGDSAYAIVKNAPSNFILNLNVNNTPIATVTKSQVVSFKEAKERIEQVVGLRPKLMICADSEPNAFAVDTKGGMIVGVTVGMLKILDGDENMTAAVVGHEIAHHTSNHRFQTDRNQFIVNALATLIGIYVENRLQLDHGIAGVGQNLAVISSALTLSKFSRDQEREADAKGLNYMIGAGYDPEGAIRLADLLSSRGLGGSGLFYDSHPSWDERAQRLRALIDNNPKAKTLLTLNASKSQSDSTLADKASESAKLDVLFSLKDPEKLLNESYQLYQKDKKDEAIKLLIKSAELGNAIAQANMCEFYFQGVVVKHDLKEAVRFCKASASQANPIGQFNLGYLYFKGAGVEQNSEEGLRLYRLAVDQGFGWATSALAQIYQFGLYGVQQDTNLALDLYGKAAGLGEPNAYGQLGVIYCHGELVEKNLPIAIDYLNKGVALGNTTAALELGTLYISGEGVIKDEKEGMRLVKFAADKNHVLAQYNLAIFYSRKGDNNNALTYFKLAAKNGLPQAKSFLDQNRISY